MVLIDSFSMMCIHTRVYICMYLTSWLIPSSFEGCLGCFQVSALINSAAVNTGVLVPWLVVYLGIYSLWIAGSYIILLSVFWWTFILFAQWLHQLTLPPAVEEGSLFSISSPVFICRFSKWWPFWPRVKGVPCSFDSRLSNNAEHLFICLLATWKYACFLNEGKKDWPH